MIIAKRPRRYARNEAGKRLQKKVLALLLNIFLSARRFVRKIKEGVFVSFAALLSFAGARQTQAHRAKHIDKHTETQTQRRKACLFVCYFRGLCLPLRSSGDQPPTRATQPAPHNARHATRAIRGNGRGMNSFPAVVSKTFLSLLQILLKSSLLIKTLHL